MKYLFTLLTVVLIPAMLHAVSFNCDNASTVSEHAICSSYELGRLDDQLSKVYKKIKFNSTENTLITIQQRKWLMDRDECRYDRKCIKTSYENRISELKEELINSDDYDEVLLEKVNSDNVKNQYKILNSNIKNNLFGAPSYQEKQVKLLKVRASKALKFHYYCKDITTLQADNLLRAGHTYLDADNDGIPCEWYRDMSSFSYQSKTYSRPVISSNNCHHVSGYVRNNGTYVSGYTRCR